MSIRYILFFSVLMNLLCIESDFNVVYRATSDGNQFINLINNLYIEVEMSFGSNEQKFKSELDLSSYCVLVPGVEFNKSDVKGFDRSSSTSFTEIGRIDSFSLEKIYKAIIGQDTIKIGESESINSIQFLVVTEYTFSIFNSYSYIGLDFNTITSNFKNLNLLGQLKNNSIIEKQLWYLDFADYSKGKFVIGKFPHEVKNETYKEKDRYTTNFVRTDYYPYRIEFSEIYYGNLNKYNEREIMKEHNEAIITINTRLIYSTSEYAELIHNKFFGKKLDDKICFREKLNQNSQYYFHYCYKDKVNINEMDNINFYIRDTNMTFVLTPKDLFYEHDEYLYFLVVNKELRDYDTDKDTEWRLGLQFLKKYTLTFDINDKLFHYYKVTSENKENNNDNDNQEKKEGENKGKRDNYKYIIIIIVLVVVFVACVSILVFYILKIKPRKIKVNELDEAYDYETKDKNKGNDYLIN